jgi:hypothetical protein
MPQNIRVFRVAKAMSNFTDRNAAFARKQPSIIQCANHLRAEHIARADATRHPAQLSPDSRNKKSVLCVMACAERRIVLTPTRSGNRKSLFGIPIVDEPGGASRLRHHLKAMTRPRPHFTRPNSFLHAALTCVALTTLAGCLALPTGSAETIALHSDFLTLRPGESTFLSAFINGTGDFDRNVDWNLVSGAGELEVVSRSSLVFKAQGTGPVTLQAISRSNPNLQGTIKLNVMPATPYRFVPSGVGVDDASRLQDVIRVHRWVQIDGPAIQIDQPVKLETRAGEPLHNLLIEPSPAHATVRVHTRISNNLQDPTNPKYSPFDYDGNLMPGSYLLAATNAGSTFVDVQTPSTIPVSRPPEVFKPGDTVYVNDATTYPNPLLSPLAPHDGAMEVRQVIGVRQDGSTTRLELDRPLNRPHHSGVIAARAEPLRFVQFRNLEFSSDFNVDASSNAEPRVGIHLHMAYRALIEGISSLDWGGFSLILLDTGGVQNVVRNVQARGAGPMRLGLNGWGIALEGQEESRIESSSVTKFWEGIVINYSFKTIAYDSLAFDNHDVGMTVNSDGGMYFDTRPDRPRHGSVASGFVRARISGTSAIGAHVGPYCQDCLVDATITGHAGSIRIREHAQKTVISGAISNYRLYGVGFHVSDATSNYQVLSAGTQIHLSLVCETGLPLAGIDPESNIVHLPDDVPDSVIQTGLNFSFC